MNHELTAEQKAAVAAALAYCRDPRGKPHFTIAGLAGTGKTVTLSALAEAVSPRVVLAPTGKAALRLREKGVAGAGTIHSFRFNRPSVVEKDKRTHEGELVFSPKDLTRFEDQSGPLLIDESSMVDSEVLGYLLQLERPIVFVGDHGQLPPVDADPGIMARPDVVLQEVHRQAAQSNILKLSRHVRAGNEPPAGRYGDDLEIVVGGWPTDRQLLAADIVITGSNGTRCWLNKRIRELRGFGAPYPTKGERVVCLTNNHRRQILNGQILEVLDGRPAEGTAPLALADLQSRGFRFRVESGGMIVITPDELVRLAMESPKTQPIPKYRLVLEGDDGPLEAEAPAERFGRHIKPRLEDLHDEDPQNFDFGYAVTCHKSQGSEWSNVLVVEDCIPGDADPRRWRYTAITRASRRLTYCILPNRRNRA